MSVSRFYLGLGRGNARWESVFAEVGKGEENRNFWLSRREIKGVMCVSQATCSKIKIILNLPETQGPH